MTTAALDNFESGWHPRYWILALALPLVLFAGEAGSLLAFEHFRAPNASLFVQMVAMLGFFAVLGAIPRVLWLAFAKAHEGSWPRRKLWTVIGLLGVALGTAHLALLALIKVALFASPDWSGNPANVAVSVGETWLNFGAIWIAVFALIVLGTRMLWNRGEETRAEPFAFSVRRNDQLLRIAADDVEWIEAEGNYLELHCPDHSYTVRDTIARLSPLLSSHGFVRSHRSALINGRHLRGVRSCKQSSSYRVILASGREAPLGRRRLAEIRALLD